MKTQLTVTSKNYMTLPDGRHFLGANLHLYVKRNGATRSWVFRYRLHGKRIDFSIGPAKKISIQAARARAVELDRMIAEGIDPKEERRKSNKSRENLPEKFKEFAPVAIDAIAELRMFKNEKHVHQWHMTVDRYAVPFIGNLRMDEITRRDIVELLEPIWLEKSETADRLRGRLEAIFDRAIALGLTENNPAVWKGGLSAFLPPLTKVHEIKHHEALSLKATRNLMREMLDRKKTPYYATAFGILTATRAQEFLGARWEEINLRNKTWTIPPERMKCGLAHRVPLSKQAYALLLIAGPKKSGLVFPGNHGSRISVDTPRLNVRRLTGTTATMHGFRSTFRDWCEENFIHEALAERSLAHVKTDKVVQAYQRSDLLEQRREVMQRWADAILPTPPDEPREAPSD